jgi:hypothetical protein
VSPASTTNRFFSNLEKKEADEELEESEEQEVGDDWEQE